MCHRLGCKAPPSKDIARSTQTRTTRTTRMKPARMGKAYTPKPRPSRVTGSRIHGRRNEAVKLANPTNKRPPKLIVGQGGPPQPPTVAPHVGSKPHPWLPFARQGTTDLCNHSRPTDRRRGDQQHCPAPHREAPDHHQAPQRVPPMSFTPKQMGEPATTVVQEWSSPNGSEMDPAGSSRAP